MPRLRFKSKRQATAKLSNSGFTLIEAVLSIAILMIGIWAVVQFFPYGIRVTGDSQNISTATNIGLNKIEELRTTSYDELNTGTIEAKHAVSNDPNSYLSAYKRETIVSYIDSNFAASQSDQGLKKIVVTVYWRSPISNKEKNLTFTTIATKY